MEGKSCREPLFFPLKYNDVLTFVLRLYSLLVDECLGVA